MQVGLPRDVIEAYTDTVEVDRQVDELGHPRWGSGEGRIIGVELLDSSAQVTSRLHSGQPAYVRLHYEMHEPIESPVFGLAIRTLDGFEVSGLSSRDVDCAPDKLEGRGHVDVFFDALRLLPGTYDLTVSLSDHSRLHTYDVRRDLIRFDVERGTRNDESGVVSLGGCWKIGNLLAGAEPPRAD
jgi:hypothetical protein